MHSYYFKVYGERNSGTNYIQRVLRRNVSQQELVGDHKNIYSLAKEFSNCLQPFDQDAYIDSIYDIEMNRILYSDFGWKHAAPPVEIIVRSSIKKLTVFVFILKHPYFWLRSMFRKPFHIYGRANTFAEFIRLPMMLSQRDLLPGWIALTPIEIWTEKVRRYAELCSQAGIRAVVYRYEDLLLDFDKQILRVSRVLTPKSDIFENMIESTKNESLQFEDYRTKYDLSRVSEVLSKEDSAYVREHLSNDVLKWSGYTL